MACKFLLLCCVLPTFVAGSTPEGDVCLLSKRVRVHRSSALSQVAVEHRTWRLQHKVLELATAGSKVALDEYVANQTNSSDSCAARIRDSQNQVDELTNDLKDVSDQVKGHQKMLETDTEDLNVVQMSVKAVEEEDKEEKEKCAEEKQKAAQDVEKYTKDKQNLEAIAAQVAEKNSKLSLVQVEGSLDRESCLAFVAFAKHAASSGADPKVAKAGKKSCDQQREELTKDFNEAYNETQKLIEKAKEGEKDPTCDQAAEAKKAAALVPLASQQKDSSKRAEQSSEAIAALKPILSLSKKRVEKLKDHIEKDIKPECEAAEKVTDTLKRVEDEIESLKKCPPKKNFSLQAPGQSGAANATAQAVPEGSKAKGKGFDVKKKEGKGKGKGLDKGADKKN